MARRAPVRWLATSVQRGAATPNPAARKFLEKCHKDTVEPGVGSLAGKKKKAAERLPVPEDKDGSRTLLAGTRPKFDEAEDPSRHTIPKAFNERADPILLFNCCNAKCTWLKGALAQASRTVCPFTRHCVCALYSL